MEEQAGFFARNALLFEELGEFVLAGHLAAGRAEEADFATCFGSSDFT